MDISPKDPFKSKLFISAIALENINSPSIVSNDNPVEKKSLKSSERRFCNDEILNKPSNCPIALVCFVT